MRGQLLVRGLDTALRRRVGAAHAAARRPLPAFWSKRAANGVAARPPGRAAASGVARRAASAAAGRDGGTGGAASSSSTSAEGIVAATDATARWKRDQQRRIADAVAAGDEAHGAAAAAGAGAGAPPPINGDEDVQPMWQQMESRVTRRRPLTLEERGGVSGRRNVRRSDEDLWLAAGVYDAADPPEEEE